MQVRILYFAVLREKAGRDQRTLEIESGATVATTLAALGRAEPEIAAWLPRIQVAVNQQMVPPEHPLHEGDEVALIPPVAGGAAGRRIAVTADALGVSEVIAAVESEGRGGIAVFLGCVRDHGQLQNVQRLEYEAYEPMAVAVLTAIADEIEREWPGAGVAIHHRTGTLSTGETAVVVAAGAPHRDAAFAACRAAIERLKQRAPIWKKEISADGSEWVGQGP